MILMDLIIQAQDWGYQFVTTLLKIWVNLNYKGPHKKFLINSVYNVGTKIEFLLGKTSNFNDCL